MIICLCGKSCSGKSYLAKYLVKSFNAVHVDIDQIGHDSLMDEEVKNKLVDAFGNAILKDNAINRKELGKIVFNSNIEMDKLTDITWPYMENKIDDIILNNLNRIIILDYLLLPKTKYFKKCNLRILLDVPLSIRKERAMKRDNILEEEFLLREKATYQYNLDDFDIVLKDDNYEIVKKLVREKVSE